MNPSVCNTMIVPLKGTCHYGWTLQEATEISNRLNKPIYLYSMDNGRYSAWTTQTLGDIGYTLYAVII